MFRFVSPVLLALATFSAAQPEAPATPPPAPPATPQLVKPVLRALPLGGDDDINSRPIPEVGEAL
ncbi:MAG: hypothetical protein EOP85_14200, partial [Verrucomicrobiaceae bacterium]